MASNRIQEKLFQPNWLQMSGARMVLLDVQEGIYNLRQILRDGMGEAEAGLMFDVGYRMGQTIARSILLENDARSTETTFDAALQACCQLGIGDLQAEELIWEKGWAVVTCSDTFEGWAYAKNDNLQSEGKCDYSRGVLTSLMIETHRAAETSTNKLGIKDILCVEVGCVGRGDPECRFVVGSEADLKAAGLTISRPIPTMRSQLEELLITAQRRAVQLEVSREVAQRLMAALDLDELMAQIVRLVQNQFGYYHVHIYLLDPGTGFLNLREGTGEPGRIMKENGHRISPGQGLVGKVVQTGMSMLVPDVSQESQWLPNPLLPETRSELTVPLRLGDEILGVLDVQGDRVGGITVEDISLLEGLGSQIAVAIQNAHLFESERRQRLEAATLQEVSRSLSLSLGIDEILGIVLEQLQKVVTFDSAAIFLREREIFRAVVSMDFPGQEPGVHRDFATVFSLESEPVFQEIVKTRKPLVLFDAQQGRRSRQVQGTTHAHGWIGAPLIVRDEVVGILAVGSQQHGAYNAQVAQTVSAFASQAAIAIQNAALFAELETHRAKLEDQIAERTRELRGFQAFAETAPDAILLSDLDDIIRYANPACYELFGYNAASNEALGLSVTRLIHKDDSAKIEDKVPVALEAEGSHRGNITLVRKAGSSFLADVIIFLVRDDEGLPTAHAYIIRDITAEQQAQQEQVHLRENLITAQQRLIEELSTPIIPVTDDVLVLPLVGSIDNRRAQQIIQALLKGIENYRAQIVIVDITGVPRVDSGVANYLMQAAHAVRLLGAEAVLVGITPQVAQAFVSLDVDLGGIVTRSDLQSGIEYALSQVGLHIARKPTKMEQMRKMLEAQMATQTDQPRSESESLA